jgi:dephospho-CoA kinase
VVICVTGKIGTGKSTAAKIISDLLGAEVIDVDEIGHEVLEMEEVKESVKKTFGSRVFSNGEIDRKKLGEVVFRDPKALRKLEEIVHPIMREIVLEKVKKAKDLIIDCALLKRMKLVEKCDFIITVISSYETARKRKQISEERFKAIWDSQRDIGMMGTVIENEGSLEDLRRKISEVLGLEE